MRGWVGVCSAEHDKNTHGNTKCCGAHAGDLHQVARVHVAAELRDERHVLAGVALGGAELAETLHEVLHVLDRRQLRAAVRLLLELVDQSLWLPSGCCHDAGMHRRKYHALVSQHA